MSGVIEEAIDAYRRDLFWDQYEQGIDHLRQDPSSWADYTREQEEEAGALGDGLRSE